MSDQDIAARVAELIRTHGLAGASKVLGTCKEATARLAVGAVVRKGTLAMAEKHLTALDATATESVG